ncbi:hypothetical protein SUGI_0350960 [Cryptomeria japonica]|nr:hypothetical protein SUGI_0350960 [Cryptomeria japonica]
MAEKKQKELRVVMFPGLSQGHITPFLELAKSLASHGLKIFFVSTPPNIKRIKLQAFELQGLDLVELAMEKLPTDGESDNILTHQELAAIAMGLQESNASFLWILPAQNDLPQGFQDKIREKGLVVTKWAPQLHILSHQSTGAFFTHGGWNSMTEGLRFGVPLIYLPMKFEHGLNARLAKELKVGVEVSRNEEDGSFTKEDIRKAIRVIMVEGAQIKCNSAKICDMLTSNNFQVSERNMRRFVSMLRTFNK